VFKWQNLKKEVIREIKEGRRVWTTRNGHQINALSGLQMVKLGFCEHEIVIAGTAKGGGNIRL
jgi:hypothetical protein